jgi:multiple sugar transport system ATP-binding protein
VTTDGPGSVKRGQRVGIDFPPERVHLFDADSGVAVARRDSVPGEQTESRVETHHD